MRFVRWKRLNLTGIFDKTKPKSNLYAVQRKDGLFWAGPYRFQGATFTNYEPMIYYFNNNANALATVKGCGLIDVTVVLQPK
jgi:hypothetical protein